MSTGITGGNVIQETILGVTLSPASVAANTTAEQLFTIPNVLLPLNCNVTVNKPTAQAGLGIVGMRATAAGQLGITFGNFTASPIVPTAAEVYNVIVCMAESRKLASNLSF
jgi:hypothetical protein